MKPEYGKCWLKTGPPGREKLNAGRISSLKYWNTGMSPSAIFRLLMQGQ